MKNPIDLSTHVHDYDRWALTDARGIFIAYVCAQCEAQVKEGYRDDIFTDSQYPADEQIEPD